MSDNYTKIDTPLLEHIPGGLHPGKTFIIKGFTQYGFQGVSINFQSDSSDDAVIAFHLNPRLENNDVCCNSYDDGWGDEEIHSENFPFHEGQCFTLRIVVEEHAYRVFVNESLFLEFHHRVPFDTVRWLRISDGLELHEVIMRDFVSYMQQHHHDLRHTYIHNVGPEDQTIKTAEIEGIDFGERTSDNKPHLSKFQ